MRLWAPLANALMVFAAAAQAQVHGVDVQVSNGKRTPTVAQLMTVLGPGDFVRDVLGWARVDKACNLSSDPSIPIVIPASMKLLYDRVQEAQGRNFVTLAFNNRFCGQLTNGGGETFPDTPALQAEFAAYAVAVVKQVPALAGISIWNELSGTWDGGYSTRADRLANYCRLANTVIRAVRNVDPKLPIAIGASVGSDIDTWFIEMFDTYGCLGKGDPTIWLDVHPYLSGKFDRNTRKIDWRLFNESIDNIRGRGIANSLIATEWGAKSANLWMNAHPKGNYAKFFDTQIVGHDPAWAGILWYQMLYDRATPNAGLFDLTGSQLTPLGSQYVGAFGR